MDNFSSSATDPNVKLIQSLFILEGYIDPNDNYLLSTETKFHKNIF